jgi:hypothetical protein
LDRICGVADPQGALAARPAIEGVLTGGSNTDDAIG